MENWRSEKLKVKEALRGRFRTEKCPLSSKMSLSERQAPPDS